MNENSSGLEMNCVNGWPSSANPSGIRSVASTPSVKRKAAVIPAGKPIASARRERLATSRRRCTSGHAEGGDRPELGPDDHRSDDQDDLIGEDADRGDQHREDHEGDEARRQLDVLRRSLLDLLPHHGVGDGARRRPLRPLRGLRDLGVDLLHRDRAVAVDLELAQVADQHARVLARDVAQDHVALGADAPRAGGGRGCRRRGALQQLERLLRRMGGGNDP